VNKRCVRRKIHQRFFRKVFQEINDSGHFVTGQLNEKAVKIIGLILQNTGVNPEKKPFKVKIFNDTNRFGNRKE